MTGQSMSNGHGGLAKGYSPIEINSKDAFFPGTKFDSKFTKFEKRNCGIVSIKKAAFDAAAANLNSLGRGQAGTSGFDLTGDPMVDTAILIDYNFVLMCNHSFQSIATVMGNTAMKNGDVRVFFNNEFTAASADTHHPVAETNRPFAKLRGDLQAWTGTDDNICNEDFAIVKIEWNGADFHKINKSARMVDPSFNSDNLVGKKVCTFMQYSSRLPVNSNSRTSFSTHVAMGTVLEVKQGPRTRECTAHKNYYVYVEHNATSGSSGGGVYNENGELIGILCIGDIYYQKKRIIAFLPLDYIYKCKRVAYGIEAGQHLKNIFNTNKPGWP